MAANPAPLILDSSQRKRSDRLGERGFLLVTLAASLLAVGVLVAVAVKVFDLASPAIGKFGLGFLTSHDWNAVTSKFGALDFIYGTAVSSLVALLIAAPISVAIALFLTELAPKWLRTKKPSFGTTSRSSHSIGVSRFSGWRLRTRSDLPGDADAAYAHAGPITSPPIAARAPFSRNSRRCIIS